MSGLSKLWKRVTGMPEINLSKLPQGAEITGELTALGAVRLVNTLTREQLLILKSAVDFRLANPKQ